MNEGGTYDAALEAFESAFEGQPESAEAPGGEVEGGSQPEVPASREIDISGLPEEAQIFLRAREREMQADYTRKTQAAARERQEAEQAMQFIEALNSDPNFALQVLSSLQGNLRAAGYFDQEDQHDDSSWAEGQYEQEEADPYASELNQLKTRQAEMEQQWVEAQMSAKLDRQLAQIQSQHPDWDEQDLQDVIDYGFSTGGDLFKAAELVQARNDRALSRYLSKKGSVNTPASLPSAPANQVPQKPRTEKELHAAAKEYVMKQLS